MATLYDLKQEYLQLLDMMQDPDVDQDVLADTMEGLEGEIEIKLDGYITIRKELEADREKVEREIDRLTGEKKRLDANITKINQAVMAAMCLAEKDKLQTEHYRLAIRKNGGLQPMVITGEVPPEYCKLTPDNQKIRDALKEGALEFAELKERGTYLSVK